MPAVPLVNARLMEEALLRVWFPSTPTNDPDMVVLTPLLYLRNKSEMFLSADSCRVCTDVLPLGLSLDDLSQPLEL